MAAVHHRYVTVRGRRMFYREAGPADGPAVVLLHGSPASSFMFRDLIPRLADGYHVIAPDYLGFGLSDAPPVDEFDYTFDPLTQRTPGPARSARRRPVCDVRPGLRRAGGLAARPGRPGRGHRGHHPERQRLRGRLHCGLLEAGTGVLASTPTRGPRRASARPSAWRRSAGSTTRRAGLHRGQPGRLAARLRAGVPAGPGPSSWPCTQTTPPTRRCTRSCMHGSRQRRSRCWPSGAAMTRSSPPTGAPSLRRDAPAAQIDLLDGGHFLLESHLDTAADHIRHFLGRALS